MSVVLFVRGDYISAGLAAACLLVAVAMVVLHSRVGWIQRMWATDVERDKKFQAQWESWNRRRVVGPLVRTFDRLGGGENRRAAARRAARISAASESIDMDIQTAVPADGSAVP